MQIVFTRFFLLWTAWGHYKVQLAAVPSVGTGGFPSKAASKHALLLLVRVVC